MPPTTSATEQSIALEQLLKRVLPGLSKHPVSCAVETIGSAHGLFPAEAALVARAVDKRKNEFSAGRRCARRALAALGHPPVPLLIGPLHEPIWPTGTSGSIAHDGRLAAAVAYASPTGRVMISLDVIDLTDPAAFVEIADTIHHPAEPRRSSGHAIAGLFSAKEAAIKIVSPAIGDFVEFRQLNATETDRGFRVVAEHAQLVVDVRTFEVEGLIVSLGLAPDA